MTASLIVLAWAGSAAAAPDLLPTPPINVPAVIAKGFPTQIQYTVANFGDVSSGAFRVGFYISHNATCSQSDTLTGTAAHGSLGSFNQVTALVQITIPFGWSSGPGDHFCILVDDLNQVVESSESNNDAAIPVDVVECTADAHCDDGVGCTIDWCDGALHACQTTPDDGACDDGVFCDGDELCDPVLDCQPGAPRVCDDGVGCTIDFCDLQADACAATPDDGACDDGQFCNGAETCDPVLDCRPGTAPDCNDYISCTVDSCNESLDVCDHQADHAACDDGTYCNGVEVCELSTGCQGGPGPCADDLFCTSETCDEATQSCQVAALPPWCEEPTELPTATPDEYYGAAVAIDAQHVMVAQPSPFQTSLVPFLLTPAGPVALTELGYSLQAAPSLALRGDEAFISFSDLSSWPPPFGLLATADYDGTSWGWASFGPTLPEIGVAVAADGDVRVMGNRDAYVERWSAASQTWEADGFLRLPDPGCSFGLDFMEVISVDASGSHVVVGTVNCEVAAADGWAAHFFEHDGSTWSFAQTIAEPAGAWQFGWSVSISGGLAVVGAPGDGVGGAVHVYRYDGSTWTADSIVRPPANEARWDDQFGWSVSLDGDWLVVGSPGDDDQGIDAGAAYLFERVGMGFQPVTKLVAPTGVAGQRFGLSVAQAAGRIVVGGSPALAITPLAAAEGGSPVATQAAVDGVSYLFARPDGQEVLVPATSPSGAIALMALLALAGLAVLLAPPLDRRWCRPHDSTPSASA